MMQTFDVLLGNIVVGQIGRIQSGKVLFRFSEAYYLMNPRPILGQQFEDDLRKTYVGVHQELPAFFANLVPEGPLREVLGLSLGIPANDDLQLLAAVGYDLPGAIHLRPSRSPESLLDATAELDLGLPTNVEPDPTTGLRFSLAGVQLKFSLLKSVERLLLPADGQQGDWIVKFDSQVYPGLVANEFATMQWARAAGFDVPECEISSARMLPPELAIRLDSASAIYLIKRYDRQAGVPIHQEDLAQVASLRPALKYDHWTYETCARVIGAICGPACYEEFIRRLVFMVASGNTDAHLKNWSLLYPDGVNAQLSPLYDQVAVIAWPPPVAGLQLEWALKFAGTKNLYRIDEAAFIRLAQRSGGDERHVRRLLSETLANIASAWHIGGVAELMPASHADSLRAYWHKSPLLREAASALTLF